MRERLITLLVFVAVFGATIYFLWDDSPVGGGRSHSDTPDASEKTEPLGDQVLPPDPNGNSRVPEKPAMGSAEEAALDLDPNNGPGTLSATVEGPDGPIPVLGARLNPGAGRVVQSEGGRVEIQDLPPGHYSLLIHADDFVAHVNRDVAVHRGKTTRLAVTMQRGICPAGIVVDELTQMGVPEVRVDFEGHVQVRTDSSGRFQAPYAVPHDALTFVAVYHPDYDRLTYTRPPALDPKNLRFGMTRGRAQLHGRIRNAMGIDTPDSVRLRCYLDMGNGRQELRRELAIKPSEPFHFKNMHEGFWHLHADFPGSDLRAQRKEIFIPDSQRVDTEIVFTPGATLEGRLLSRSGQHKEAPVKIELLDPKAIVVGETNSDKDGFFQFRHLDPGNYQLRVWLGMPWFNTEAIELKAGDPLKLLEVDCDLQRLKS